LCSFPSQSQVFNFLLSFPWPQHECLLPSGFPLRERRNFLFFPRYQAGRNSPILSSTSLMMTGSKPFFLLGSVPKARLFVHTMRASLGGADVPPLVPRTIITVPSSNTQHYWFSLAAPPPFPRKALIASDNAEPLFFFSPLPISSVGSISHLC